MVQGQSQPHKLLFQCNVLFLGKSDPSDVEGLKALNDPLSQAYPISTNEAVSGIDSWLSVYTSGILLQLVDGPNPPIFWFPIQNLYIAAANKRVNYIDSDTREIQGTKFVELGEQEAQQSSHAPLFSFIARGSTDGRQQCYTFLASNDNTAFSLVDNAEYAYKNKSGHTNTIIPAEIVTDGLVNDDDSVTTTSDQGDPQIINVDDREGVIFPSRLVKHISIDRMKPQLPHRSASYRSAGVPPPVIHSASTRQAPPQQFIPPLNINPSMQRSEYAPPHQQLTPPQRSEYRIPRQQITAPQRVVSQKSKPVVREKIKVVQPPPLYIKAPPPKVMVVDRPRYIPTPPKVIREVIDRPVEVPVPYDREVIREVPVREEVRVPVEVPVEIEKPIHIPIEVPVYIQSEPEIIEREIPIEVPVQVPVPYEVQVPVEVPVEVQVPVHIRAPTPPPQIVYVPEYIDREVRVPYEVRAPTPPPQIVEVPVPVYVEVEGPPQLIREPPQVQEIPVPYPVEVPYQVPVEVPHFYPIPMKVRGRKKRRRERQYYSQEPRLDGFDWRREGERRERYSDYPLYDGGRYYGPRYQGGYGPPPQGGYASQSQGRIRTPPEPRRRDERRRRRSSSSGSSSDRGRRREFSPSNGMAGMRITEVSENGRAGRPDYSPRREDRRESRRDDRDDIEGYDYYRPNQERGKSKKSYRDASRGAEYYIKERRSRDYVDRPFSPQSYNGGQMPAHLSDSISEFPNRRHY